MPSNYRIIRPDGTQEEGRFIDETLAHDITDAEWRRRQKELHKGPEVPKWVNLNSMRGRS